MSAPTPSAAAAAARPADKDAALWREALRAGLPTLFGIAAWGMVTGVAMVKSGLSVAQALGMTVLVFAGSAQLAALPLIAGGAPVWVVFATALVVNLRFVIFSVLLAPHFAHLPWKKRFLLGYVAGDITVALFLRRFPDQGAQHGKLSYLQGLLVPNWLSWQAGSIAGVLLGAAVPASWGLGFAGSLAILCIMVPLVINRAALCGVLVAAATSVVFFNMPYKLGLLLAVALGMGSAMLVEETLEKRRARHE
ncbi:AzlC family ABC transporter permease [Massilia glaciei]|uniref:Branched-chain amino acid transporter AzlC n=1 Tax=Massilia glaciei TaxID=1524097 RepID=A0A2U2I4U2_9BURK|nr:AzlC family ABC transporter permease [Massilia glaciei]PWF54753.1 branched-chain amino acid transporter AzlC [Massilia glaciei]